MKSVFPTGVQDIDTEARSLLVDDDSSNMNELDTLVKTLDYFRRDVPQVVHISTNAAENVMAKAFGHMSDEFGSEVGNRDRNDSRSGLVSPHFFLKDLQTSSIL